MEIKQLSLKELITEADKGHLLIPRFQRDYVWNSEKVGGLLHSILQDRPVGMATAWLQPQGHPHSPPKRFSIDDAGTPREFGSFVDVPSVTALVLDGRQRITTILHVFTENFYAITEKKGPVANRWFVDLSKQVDDEDFIFEEKAHKLSKRKLDSVASCIAQGYFPLKDWQLLGRSTALLSQPETYPDGQLPSKDVQDARAVRIEQVIDLLARFKLPVAMISDTFTLSDVCEIFETLNQSGTKVSVFDLVHNNLFSNDFDMKSRYKHFKSELPASDVFGDTEPVFFAQLATSLYIADDPTCQPPRRDRASSDKPLVSVRAGDLLDTPRRGYELLISAIEDGRFGNALSDLYDSFGGKFRFNKTAYEVSFTIYFAIYLSCKTDAERSRSCRLFRSFYYRNSLLERYVQGYLSKHQDDLVALKRIVLSQPELDISAWAKFADTQLDSLISADKKKPGFLSKDELVSELLDAKADNNGAVASLVNMHLLARNNLDLLTSEILDVSVKNPDPRSVEIHHLCPKSWMDRDQETYKETYPFVECFANKVPLSRGSNNDWSADAPSRALTKNGKSWVNSRTAFERCCLIEACFNLLISPGVLDVKSLWAQRAAWLANEIYYCQFVSYSLHA